MNSVVSSVAKALDRPEIGPELKPASDRLGSLVDADAYIGEVFSLAYDEALVQVHDFHRRQVGGIPALSFLIATRIPPGKGFDPKEEDASVILLRVIDQADLPTAQEAVRVRVENAQRVAGEIEKTWDHKDVMDATTNQLLGLRASAVESWARSTWRRSATLVSPFINSALAQTSAITTRTAALRCLNPKATC